MRHTTGAQDTVEIRLYRDLSGVLLNVGIQCWVNYLRADAGFVPNKHLRVARARRGPSTFEVRGGESGQSFEPYYGPKSGANVMK